MTYLGFVLGAMGTDYYPRLSACIHDPAAACRLVNEQTEVALLLTAPALIALLAVSPWLIPLLYTAEFAPAVGILHFQLLGDLLKVMSWPLGFVILAAGAGRTFILVGECRARCVCSWGGDWSFCHQACSPPVSPSWRCTWSICLWFIG